MSAEARRMWTAPAVLGVLTATGLVTALVSDDWGDVWSWIGLGIPTAVMTWYAFFPARRRD
ncbi:MAG TPA: hypothetical protein VEB23_11200 [Ramlibacter sp.]|nr:hypothetical protein [Ramlibacter sp.]